MSADDPYYFPTNNYYVSNSGGLLANFDKGPGDDGDANQKLSFVHDPVKEYWIKGGKCSNRWANISNNEYNELCSKFNSQFEGKAMMIAGSGDSSGWAMSYSIVSFVAPENGKIFENFFKKNSSINANGGWNQYVAVWRKITII